MLSLAAKPAPAAHQGAAPLPGTVAAGAAHPQAHYWPCELLNTFVLRMAASGHCVTTAMMLGDSAYAREQLNIARTQQDAGLVAVAAKLQTYFDAAAPQGCAVVAEMEWASG